VSDQIHLELGAAPWRASSDAVPGEIFDFYDMPLAGQLTQHGVDFVFQCLIGVVEKANVWVYAPVDDGELSRLKALEDEDFDKALDDVMTSRDVTVAIADGDKLIFTGLVGARRNGQHGLISAIHDWFEHTLELGSRATAAL
jgi:hypothetical protein